MEESMSDTEESLQDNTDESPTVNNDMCRKQPSDIYMKQSPPYSENDDSATEENEEQTYEFDNVSQPEEEERTEVTNEITEDNQTSTEENTRILHQHGKTVTDTIKVLEDLLEHHHIETNPDEQKSDMTQSGMYKKCVGICMTQMTVRAGIKIHGQDAVIAF